LAELPPEGIKEDAPLPTGSQLELLIANLPYMLGEAVWLVAVTCIRPEELAFKWSDLDVEKRQLWIKRAGEPQQAPHAEVSPPQPPDSAYQGRCRTPAQAEAVDECW
jgi:hypothetical protein